MAIEAARAVLDKIRTDERFRRLLSEAPPAERLALIRSEGFDVDEAEWEQAVRELDERDLLELVKHEYEAPVLHKETLNVLYGGCCSRGCNEEG